MREQGNIRGFGQRMRCVRRNKELTPKGDDMWKHVTDTIRYYFFHVFPRVLGCKFCDILHKNFTD